MSTIIKSKARIFGECINTYELLLAIKNEVFSIDEAPIEISSESFVGTLTMVYLCQKCAKLHLVCGSLQEGHCVSRENIVVCADHTADGKYVSKKELVEILEHLQEIRNVCLQHVYGKHNYTLTEVSKCHSLCPAIHLNSAYYKDCAHLT